MELAFCGQEHAQQWFAAPLPPEPDVSEPDDEEWDGRYTWRERILGALLVVSVLWGLMLMALGSYELVHLLGGWD